MIFRFRPASFVILVILAVAAPLSADDEPRNGLDFSISGYYKNIFEYQRDEQFYRDTALPPEEKVLVADLNRLRLSPELDYGENFILHGDFDAEIIAANFIGTSEFELLFLEPDYYDIIKPSCKAGESEHTYSRFSVKNVYAKLVAGKFNITAGKQQVRFGSSRLWNPLDIFNPLSPLLIDGSDTRRGVDALRIDWYPGESTELTIVWNPVRESETYDDMETGRGNFISRLKTGLGRVDAALLAGYVTERKNAGADIAAEVFDGLLTAVFLYSSPDKGENYYQAGAGYEYTFSSGLYLLMEYFYNSLPVNESDELENAVTLYTLNSMDREAPAILSNRIMTYNSHYISTAAGYDIFPLLRVEIFSIYDFQGRGFFLNSLLRLNAMENLDLSAGLVAAAMGNDEYSDFSSYRNSPLFYLILQYYF